MSQAPSPTARTWRGLNGLLIVLGFVLPSFRGCQGEPLSTAQQVGGTLDKPDQWILGLLLLLPLLYGVLTLLRAATGSPERLRWRIVPLAVLVLHGFNLLRSQVPQGIDQMLVGLWLTVVAAISSVLQEAAEFSESRRRPSD
jgi:hypothetical protein